ncbi:MAG: PQQ-binding-like beta-propeller repeat protein [Armatimonadetes bacterium]|nr:PQQ-binding-like beta-propeller repeat protein [Armatimonadota bacterium]
MKDTIARTLRTITVIVGVMMLCAPVMAQNAIWGRYHYDVRHSGQNPNSTDIKGLLNGPSSLNLIWVFPRLDSAYDYPDESAMIVDDFSGTGFSRTGKWSIGHHTDAYNGDFHMTKTINVATGTAPTATWFWPSNLPAGKYQVYVWVPPASGFLATSRASYTVYDDAHPGGETYVLDQSSAGAWKLLTSDYFTFGANANTRVELTARVLDEIPRADYPDRVVVADAIKFTPSLLETGIQIYSSPASAEIPVELPPEDPDKGSLWNGKGLCTYIGTVEPRSTAARSDDSEQTDDYGAIYCVYGITPTLQNPALADGSPDPNIPDSEKLVAISKYLGKPKWRYPNADPTKRLPIEGPISGGIYSSPTLVKAKIGNDIKLVCFVAAMDHQIYALDATTGKLLWKGPGITIPEEDAVGFRNYTLSDLPNPDSFGGTFSYAECSADGGNTITWTFQTTDQISAAPDGAEGLSYSIYAWMPGAGGTGGRARSNMATYTITYQDESGSPNETSTVTVNQGDPKAYGSWVKLGGSFFNPSQVVLNNTAANEPPGSAGGPGRVASDFVVVADAIMIVPDAIEGLGYSSPVTDAEPMIGSEVFASHVFTTSVNGRAMSFSVESRGSKYVGHLDWVYPRIRQVRSPKQSELEQPSWGDIGASPAYSADKLYVATTDGTVRCLQNVKTPSPSQKWVFPDDVNNDEKTAAFTSSPTLDPPGRLYIGSTDGIFYCLSMDTGAVDKGNGTMGPIWQYPQASSSGSPDSPPTIKPPLGAFRYSTPALATVHGIKRVWCASTDGHVYSFLADTGERLYLDDEGRPVNQTGDWYAEPSLMSPVQGSVALDGQSPQGNSVMYVGDMSGTLHWRDAENGTTNNWEYSGWTCPDMLFSSPNITNIEVATTPVSWVFVGCADGHLFAFTRRGGGWGGVWQGGEWPFPGEPNDNSSKTQAAPETEIQFDIFDQDFYNATSSFETSKLDPLKTVDSTTSTDSDFIANHWPNNIIVSKDMKVLPASIGTLAPEDPEKDRQIKSELIERAKQRRQEGVFPVGRVPKAGVDQIYFEWGEKICLILWNLPEAKFISGSGANAFTFTMTNASAGASAGSTLKATVGDVRSYTVVYDAGTAGAPVYSPVVDSEGNVRRSFVLATISLDGSGGTVQPSPGPGWVLSVQIKIKANDSSNAPVTTVTIPLAKLVKKDKYYEPLIIDALQAPVDGVVPKQVREANIGINNPLAIRDEKGAALGWGNGINPNRFDPDVHTNGNTRWTNTSGGNYNLIPVNPPPIMDMLYVQNGTSSREAKLGVLDRSAMGLAGRKINRFRIDSSDLTFRGWPHSVESQPLNVSTNPPTLIPNVEYGLRFPWDGGLGSVDYPHIYRRYQAYEQLSSGQDPTNTACELKEIDKLSGSSRYEDALLNPDTMLVSVDVPRFQPANTWVDVNRNDGLDGYSRTMTAYVDSNRNDRFDSGNYVRGRPTAHQDTYRRFRVGLKVPPDPKIEVEEQLVDIGSAPHGLGWPMESRLGFSPYNASPHIRQWFKPLTIKNAGNVNLYNIRINPAVGLVSDQAHPGAVLSGEAITSSLDPLPIPSFGLFGADPFITAQGSRANGQNVYLGYTLSKPRVGDPDPTVMTVPDRRKWDVEYDTRMNAATKIAMAGWAAIPEKAEPLPVQVGLRVPLTQPIGTYQSIDPNLNAPYIAVFADLDGAGYLPPGNPAHNPVAWPSFQLKATVRENQLTGGVTPTTLPQIDYMLGNDGVIYPEMLPRVGDATPAAFRDADKLDVHLVWSSNRFSDPDLYPSDEAEQASMTGAPWFLRRAVLGYQTSPASNGVWATASDQSRWWITRNNFLPSDQWMPSQSGANAPQLLPWEFGSSPSGLHSVRHFSPRIGDNDAVALNANTNRTWLAWAGNADFKDPATDKLSQQSAIFYTDYTHGGSDTAQKIWAIEHDFSMSKRSPCPVPYGSDMWMFWQGGSSGSSSIYYSLAHDPGGVFDTTKTKWSPDTKLRTPDCLSAVGAPNAIPRDIRFNNKPGLNAKLNGFMDPNAKRVFDVVYAGASKLTGNSDIIMSRYLSVPPVAPVLQPENAELDNLNKLQPSRIAQPLPRVFDELLVRDPKFGFFTSRHLAWSRAGSNGPFGLDRWGAYSGSDPAGPDAPYIRVFFPDGYDDGAGNTLAADTAISATDGSVWVNGNVSLSGKIIKPEVDDATGIYTYSYDEDSVADKILGKTLVDYSAGIIRFTNPLKEVQIASGPRKGAYSTPEVRADYTPRAWRITTDAAADGSPHAFIEHTQMDPGVIPGLDPDWASNKPAPVDRMWVFWRKTGTAVDSSTVFYTTMRIGVDLKQLGLPPIPMNDNGTIDGATKLEVTGALGPWEVDRTGTKIYFTEIDERYRSLNAPENNNEVWLGQSPGPISISFDSNKVKAELHDVSCITELPEQSLFGFASGFNVNEGGIYAFADPQPDESGTSVGIMSSKIWVFWTSTRGGSSNLFWETISPNFWAR